MTLTVSLSMKLLSSLMSVEAESQRPHTAIHMASTWRGGASCLAQSSLLDNHVTTQLVADSPYPFLLQMYSPPGDFQAG